MHRWDRDNGLKRVGEDHHDPLEMGTQQRMRQGVCYRGGGESRASDLEDRRGR